MNSDEVGLSEATLKEPSTPVQSSDCTALVQFSVMLLHFRYLLAMTSRVYTLHIQSLTLHPRFLMVLPCFAMLRTSLNLNIVATFIAIPCNNFLDSAFPCPFSYCCISLFPFWMLRGVCMLELTWSECVHQMIHAQNLRELQNCTC